MKRNMVILDVGWGKVLKALSGLTGIVQQISDKPHCNSNGKMLRIKHNVTVRSCDFVRMARQ